MCPLTIDHRSKDRYLVPYPGVFFSRELHLIHFPSINCNKSLKDQNLKIKTILVKMASTAMKRPFTGLVHISRSKRCFLPRVYAQGSPFSAAATRRTSVYGGQKGYGTSKSITKSHDSEFGHQWREPEIAFRRSIADTARYPEPENMPATGVESHKPEKPAKSTWVGDIGTIEIHKTMGGELEEAFANAPAGERAEAHKVESIPDQLRFLCGQVTKAEESITAKISESDRRRDENKEFMQFHFGRLFRKQVDDTTALQSQVSKIGQKLEELNTEAKEANPSACSNRCNAEAHAGISNMLIRGVSNGQDMLACKLDDCSKKVDEMKCHLKTSNVDNKDINQKIERAFKSFLQHNSIQVMFSEAEKQEARKVMREEIELLLANQFDKNANLIKQLDEKIEDLDDKIDELDIPQVDDLVHSIVDDVETTFKDTLEEVMEKAKPDRHSCAAKYETEATQGAVEIDRSIASERILKDIVEKAVQPVRDEVHGQISKLYSHLYLQSLEFPTESKKNAEEVASKLHSEVERLTADVNKLLTALEPVRELVAKGRFKNKDQVWWRRAGRRVKGTSTRVWRRFVYSCQSGELVMLMLFGCALIPWYHIFFVTP